MERGGGGGLSNASKPRAQKRGRLKMATGQMAAAGDV